MFSLFFFPGRGDLRDLHSFPTRRSSDLSLRSGTPYMPLVAGDINGDGNQNDRAFIVDPVKAAEDRKSTRLNSSHPSTSYAVFCLKKKISPSMHASVLLIASEGKSLATNL